MKRQLNKKVHLGIFIFFCLPVLLTTFAYTLILKKDLADKSAKVTALSRQVNKRDPFIDYALSFEKYDSKGAKPRSFSCFDSKPKENMTPKEKFWYDAADHNPVIPEDNPKIDVIEASLKKLHTQADQICVNQTSTDYVAIYRYEYEKGLYKNSADLYRFNKDLTYSLHHLSDDFAFVKIVSWLSNNDLVYDVIGNYDNHTVYVFTATNEDVLLEVCNINMNSELTNGNLTARFTCKDFNAVTNSSNYLPDSFLGEYVGAHTF